MEHIIERDGLRLTVAGGTRVGRRYHDNFDVLRVDPTRPMVLVADGMGSGRGSATAGRVAVDTFVGVLDTAAAPTADTRAADGDEPATSPSPARADGPVSGPSPARAVDAGLLQRAVARAQARVRAAGATLPELTGCTLTALIVQRGAAWITHIGDSRVYRLRAGLLEPLTMDHTVAWLGSVHGWWHADSSQAATARYQLTRYVGHPELPEADLAVVSLRPGDVYCVCTDGVTDQIPYRRLRDLLVDDHAPDTTVTRVLDDTLAAGGRDNATLAILRVATAPH